jgi:hypothetical protein
MLSCANALGSWGTMSNDVVVGIYEQGALPGRQIQEAIEEAQRDLAADADALAELGVSSDEVGGLFVVKERSGIDPGSILIAIVIGAGSKLAADAAKGTAKALWAVVLKRIREKRGSDAFGAERQETGDQ